MGKGGDDGGRMAAVTAAGRNPCMAAALAALLAGAAAFAAYDGVASSMGAWDKRALGCTCHSTAATASIAISVSGFPDHWGLGNEYRVTVRLDFQPFGNASERRAGFNAEVSHGTLAVPPDAVQTVQSGGAQATHRPAGTNQTAWNFTWRAPDAAVGVVALWVTVNSVNGDGVPGPGDGWAQVLLEATGPTQSSGDGGGGAGSGSARDIVFEAGLAAGGAAASAVALVWVWRSKRRARAGHVRRRRRKKKPRRRRKRARSRKAPRRLSRGR